MILSVQGINFQYNSREVLQEVTFSLERGNILGVIGVNGAGKSTLLKCINRILKPSAGVVLVDGEDILRMKGTDVAKKIGYVPQKYSEDQPTVFDTVLLGRKPYIKWAATDNDIAVVESVIRTMGLEKYALRPLSSLSGGEMQKVIIARALAQEPDILLLDEPTSSLDLKNQIEVMRLISHVVNEHNMSAIISVHDLNLALRFTHNLLMLKDRKVYSLVRSDSVSPETIEQVYGVKIIMRQVEGYPIVIPVR